MPQKVATPGVSEAKDKRVGALVVKAGLATQEQVDECIAIRAKLAAAGAAKKPLADVLLQKGYVTKEGAAEVAKLNADVKQKMVAEATAKAAGAAAPLTAADVDPLAPSKLKIPGYDIIELLGKGGMGAVYKARQKSLDRIVALKVLSPDIARDETYLKRFTTEARALARLNHENIIQGIDVGEANGYRYFAMEYVEGDTLAKVIERDGPLAEKLALTISMQIARALVHADKSSLVHRDVKPQNIMIGRNDVAKLCDLGLAMTAEERKEARERGQSIGTPHYISPEQARGEHHVDIRSDIYSLGATLYHAVTGETPFSGTSPMVLMTKHLTEEPVPPRKRNPAVSRPLNDLILKMMAKEKEKRYQTPIELLEDMERVLAGRSIEAGSASGRQKGGAAPERAEKRTPKGAKAAKDGAVAGKPKHHGAPAKHHARAVPEGEDDVEGEGEEPHGHYHRPKKQSPAVMGLIGLGVLLFCGILAFAIFKTQTSKAPPGPPPPSREVEEAARQSLENIRTAYNAKNIDKFHAIRLYNELTGKFERTQAAAAAKEDIARLEKVKEELEPAPADPEDEEAAPPAPARQPLGAKSEEDERAARERGDEVRSKRAPE